jgi:hypothetical protein
MEVNITFLPDKQIVFVKTSGEADAKSSNLMIKSIMESMMEHNSTHCLIDHTDVRFVSGSTMEIYQRPNELIKAGVPFNVKLAAVVLEIYKDHFGFLETVCANRGINYRTFFDQETAIQWLMS